MGILPDHAIEALRVGHGRDAGRHVVEPWSQRGTQNGMSFGLSCAGYDVRCKQGLFLCKGDFMLASTLEHF